MVTGSAAKRLFHFSGDGIYHNLAIFAANLEEATKEWLEKRKLISGSPAGTATTPAVPTNAPEQSTPTQESEAKSELQ